MKRDEKIIVELRNGARVSDLATKYKVSRQWVYVLGRRQNVNIDKIHSKQKKLDVAKLSRLASKCDLTSREIITKSGIKTTVVRKYLCDNYGSVSKYNRAVCLKRFASKIEAVRNGKSIASVSASPTEMHFLRRLCKSVGVESQAPTRWNRDRRAPVQTSAGTFTESQQA